MSELDRVLSLVAERVAVIHPRRVGTAPFGGGDIDCAVSGLDPMWPLRLPGDIQLCQRLWYDLRGSYWVLVGSREVVALDTLEDPTGVGRYGFSTARALRDQGEIQGLPPREPNGLASSARAAYLTSKRLRKEIRDPSEWARIAQLAREAPSDYRSMVCDVFGRRTGARIAASVLAGSAPSRRFTEAARMVRRFRTPRRTALIAALSVRRILDRLRCPTGLLVVVAGPDGSGKSTLARSLKDECSGLFRRFLHLHWRGGLLPRPGALLGKAPGDPTEPHGRVPHGMLLSLALLGYYWLDFLVEGWLRLRPLRARSTLIVVERGWWDIAVDPARYRLRVPKRLVRLLGLALPAPDIVLLLDAPADVVHTRKDELSKPQIEAQREAWETVLPHRFRRVVIPALDVPEMRATTRAELVQLLESRAAARLGEGWLNVASRETARFVLPRAPRAVARAGLKVYHPVTRRARLSWSVAGAFAAVGGFRILPRGSAPPRAVREALAHYVPPRGTIAVARANHPGRWTALLVRAEGSLAGIAKVATDDDDRLKLRAEAEAIDGVARNLAAPLYAPGVIAADDGILVLEAVSTLRRRLPWRLDEEVAEALGRFSRTGWAHGDFAPWNLLRTARGWALVDWENARAGEAPFFDLFHYVVQAHGLLGRPHRRDLVAGLEGRGWLGRVIEAYARAAGVDAADAPSELSRYLQTSLAPSVEETRDERRNRRARYRLLLEIEGGS